MPYTESNGHNIHYTLDGDGPLLVLQHGFLSSAASWHDAGYVDVFSKHFTVACVDSLAHGHSDLTEDPARYDQARRAEDIAAVIADTGHERAHVLGYSMGAWIAVGVAKYAPDRLASLGIGGWDCVEGMSTYAKAMGISIDFDTLTAGISATAPELAKELTDAKLPALKACFGALSDLNGNVEAVQALDVPVILWDGRDDHYHDPMQVFAEANGFGFISVAGDHLAAMVENGPQNAEALIVALKNP